MIAKEITKKSHNTASFKRLADYITRANTPSPIPAAITHCAGQGYSTAVKCIESLQNLARGNQDKSYHLVLSFHPNDDLSPKRLAYIESECCKALGFDGHQRLSALHRDTKNPHLHIAINRVHPKTKRQITPYYSHKTLAQFCQRMEQELGLTPDNHTPNNEISPAARDMEAYSGKISLERYVIEDVKPALDTSNDFAELRQQLARFGLIAAPSGEGFVIGDGKVFVSAGLLGEQASSLKPTWDSDIPQPSKPEKTYQPTNPDDLWQQYQTQRNVALAARGLARETIREQSEQHHAQLSHKYRQLRREIQHNTLLNNKQKFALYQQLAKKQRQARERAKIDFQRARQDSRAQYPLPTWQDFLVDKTLQGDSVALAKLQQHTSKRGITAVIQAIESRHGVVDTAIRQALENARPAKPKLSEHQQALNTWIAARNQLVGTAKDVQEHRHFGKAAGSFVHQGTRQIAKGQFVALLSQDGITYVKPISAAQQRFLKTIRRGAWLEVNAQGQFHKKRVRS